jgi:hypothetical protein
VGLLVFSLRLEAAPVVFKSVKATFHGGTPEALLKTIDGLETSPDGLETSPDGLETSPDGLETSPDGWFVAPRFDQVQAAIFVAEKPIEADLLNLTMFFIVRPLTK